MNHARSQLVPVGRAASRPRRVWLRVAFYGTALLVGLPFAFSQVLIGTHRQPTSPPPAGFEELSIVADGLPLRAWIAPGRPDRPAAIVAHGLGDSIESYAELAQTLGRRGHTVLLLDLRGHGGSAGRYTTLGGREREDLRAAMTWLGAHSLAPTGTLLMGYSMGAVAALRAAADRSDVRAVVAEAPFDTYRASVAHHARLLYGLPSRLPLIPLTIAIAEWRAGFDADDVDAVAAARRLRAPLLAIADGADLRMPEDVVRRVYDAHPGPKRFWLVPGADHLGAMLSPEYWPRVLSFLDDNGA